MRARLPPSRVLLPHTYMVSATTMPTSSAPSQDCLFFTVCIGVVEYAPASLPPASSSLTHTRRMDGFCNQNADQLPRRTVFSNCICRCSGMRARLPSSGNLCVE